MSVDKYELEEALAFVRLTELRAERDAIDQLIPYPSKHFALIRLKLNAKIDALEKIVNQRR